MTFYVDGVASAASTFGEVFAYAPPAVIGGWIYDGQVNNAFYGSIDEMAVYNRALTTAEIQDIHAAGGSGKCPAPPSLHS